MAKKCFECYEPPATLKQHPFYGLELDKDQATFRDAIWNPDVSVVFCNAPAGSGKTFIATAVGNLMCEYGLYDGLIYIASPTQEQKQGYLKGSLEEKSEPYFEPFYEALEKLGINMNTCFVDEAAGDKFGDAYVKCLVHTYLRGVNFENKVIILDEAQNYYFDELKKVLTRVHDNCKVIVIGHSGQIDLYKNPERSGFVRYLNWFKDHDGVQVCELTKNYRGWISSHADALQFRASDSFY